MGESEIDAVHRAFYDEELRERADRPLTEGRQRRVEEFASRCRREGVRSVVEAFEATDHGLYGAGNEDIHYQWARVRIA